MAPPCGAYRAYRVTPALNFIETDEQNTLFKKILHSNENFFTFPQNCRSATISKLDLPLKRSHFEPEIAESKPSAYPNYSRLQKKITEEGKNEIKIRRNIYCFSDENETLETKQKHM